MSRRSRVSHAPSFASSLASARLKEEKKRAELVARATALKKKQQLELANFRLRLQAEELDLDTELAVVDAKSRVIDQFSKLEMQHSEIDKTVKGPCVSHGIKLEDFKGSRVSRDIKVEDVKGSRDSRDIKVEDFQLPTKSVRNLNSTQSMPHRNTESNIPHSYGLNVDTTVDNHENVLGNPTMIIPPCHDSKQTPGINTSHHSATTLEEVDVTGNPDGTVSPYHEVSYVSGVNTVLPPVATSADVIQSVVRQLRKPVPEIKKFSGDVLEYRKFLRQFETKIVLNSESFDEKMNYLEQFTVGEANKIVAGYSYLDTERGYKAARAELEERYGCDDVVATAFVQKAMSWPSVKADNAKGLDEFAIFLAECGNAVTCIEAVRVLEYPDNLKKLVAKLPFYCHDKWRNIVQQCRAKSQSVKFHHLVDFVKVEAKKAIDPTFGKAAMTANMDQGGKPSRKQTTPYGGKASFITKTSEVTSCEGKGIKQSEAPEQIHGGYNTNSERTSEKISNKPCVYCNSLHHLFHACDKFKALPIQERIDYLKSNGYCFGCMKQGHQKRICHNKATCTVCKGRHPTSLHISEKKQMDPESKSWFPKANHEASVKAYSNFSRPVSSYTGAGDGICTIPVVPVRVRMRNSPQSFQTYAFLDPGSSVSFCTESLMRQLGAEGAKLKITLDTMAEPYTMNTFAINGMEIGDLDFENVVVLPKVYTKHRIPVHKDHIPTNQDISRWKHFQGINIPELEVEVGLLVGNNIPDAYTPLELRTGSRGSPYAVRTLLGWVVWNLIRQPDSHLDGSSMFPANRADILAIEKLEELKQLDVMVRESINRDFSESVINEKREHSQEDKRFLEMVSDTMSLVYGHYQMCLPFRKADIKVPNNLEQATQRLRSLKRKMEKNPEFHRDYVDFMSKVTDKQANTQRECQTTS